MRFKQFILILFLFTVCPALFWANTPLTILVMPFQNNAGINFHEFRQYIASYLIYLADLMPGYKAVPLCKYLEYIEQKGYDPKNLKVQEIETLAANFQVDFIISGYFYINENRLAVSVDIDKFTANETALAANTFYFAMNDG